MLIRRLPKARYSGPMSRVLGLTFALTVAFAALIFGVLSIGRTRPSPLAPLFTNPDGTPCERPCLFGIQPGKTTSIQAISLLENHPFLRDVHVLKIQGSDDSLTGNGPDAFSGKQFLIHVILDRDQPVVTSVGLTLKEPGQNLATLHQLPIVPLVTLIAFVGYPESVVQTVRSDRVSLRFSQYRIIATVKPRVEIGTGTAQRQYKPCLGDAIENLEIDAADYQDSP